MEGMEPVEDVRVEAGMSVRELVEAYGRMHGFMAGHLYAAARLLAEELPNAGLRVLSFTGNLVATGLRGVLAQLVGSGLFDVVITTAGAVDHDIARGVGGTYYKGYFEGDDAELYERGIHRLGNVYVPVNSYGPRVEEFVGRLVVELLKRGMREAGTYEILRVAGELLEDEGSILRQAARAGVDVFVPGWPDGAFGTALFMEAQKGNVVKVDYYRDMRRLADYFFPRKGRAAALIVGGGISKHHVIWWSQFRGGLDAVVYVTTAVEYDGSLSGAHPREAVSWGKVKPGARRVVVYGDATIILPILAAYVLGARDAGQERPGRGGSNP